MRRTVILLLAFLALPAPAFAMDHDGPAVTIDNAAFATPHLDVLAGDTVTWHNASFRTHNVNAADGSFASPALLARSMFMHRFDTPGDCAYYCQLPPSMRGDVAVPRVLLDPTTQPAAPGKPYVLTGRAALPAGASVAIEPGGATGTVVAGGTFSAT